MAIITKIKPIQVIFGMQLEKHDNEARVVTAEFLDFYLVAVYAPHSGHCLHRLSYRVDEWDKDFHKFLNSLQEKKPVVIAGDLNVIYNDIDIFKVQDKIAGCATEERKSFQQFMKNGNWVDVFRHFNKDKKQYTAWSLFDSDTAVKQKDKGWRLDYFIVS